jgi:hypothetical protein
MQSIDREWNRTDGLFEGNSTTLALGNKAIEQDEFQFFVVFRQDDDGVFRALAEAASDVVAQFRGH